MFDAPEETRPKRRTAIVIVLSMVAIIAAWSYWLWARSPRYALRQAAVAIQNHDLTTFRKYVDVENLTSRYTSDFVEHFSEEQSALSAGMMALMQTRMAQSAKEGLERAVETGEFTDSAGKDAAPYWKKATGSESGYRGVTRVQVDGKVAQADIDVYDASEQRDITIVFKLRNVGSHWQVVEISNTKDLLRDLTAARN